MAGGSGFPVTAGVLSTASSGAEDAFIVRLNSTGQLTYGTYLGGSGTDAATGLAIGPSGNVYVAGYIHRSIFRLPLGSRKAPGAALPMHSS